MAAFFVTGSGTDIGKTWVCAGLLAAWRRAGLAPAALKPVVTGFDPDAAEHSDTGVLLAALGRAPDTAAIAAMTPFRFAAPLSPDQAAARERRRLTVDGIVAACAPVLDAADGPMLIEGAGGAMSPLNDRETMLDLACGFGEPVLFVAGTYLGALSHALTGLQVMKAAGLQVRAVLVNQSADGCMGLQAIVDSLAGHVAGTAVQALPRNAPGALFDRLAFSLLA